MNQQQPGWYYAQGDPVGTVRYWDGETWVGEPTAQAAPAGTGQPYRNYGGVLERLGARIIDFIIILIPVLVIFFLTADIDTDGSSFSASSTNLSSVFAVLIIGAVYDIGFLTTKGATPGKMMLGLRVASGTTGDSPVDVMTAAKRWAIAIPYSIPLLGTLIWFVASVASGIMISNDGESRSVRDRIAGTVVLAK